MKLTKNQLKRIISEELSTVPSKMEESINNSIAEIAGVWSIYREQAGYPESVVNQAHEQLIDAIKLAVEDEIINTENMLKDGAFE